MLEPVMKRAKYENIRHTNMLKQVNNHHNTVLKQWRALWRLLKSQRSAWASRYGGISYSPLLVRTFGAAFPPEPTSLPHDCLCSVRYNEGAASLSSVRLGVKAHPSWFPRTTETEEQKCFFKAWG